MMLSSIESLVPDVLEHIALYTVSGCLLGPPKEIVALLQTSRTFYHVLSFENNSQLYSNIFRAKFDCAAPARRLGPRWMSTPSLASELRKRFMALKRIKNRDTTCADDLWTAYLLMSENDGQNERQLIEWAEVEGYLPVVIACRSPPSPGYPRSWFTDTEWTSLTVWLLWMTSTRDGIRAESSALTKFIMWHLHPFVAAGFQYPSIFAPDSHFELPLCDHVDHPARSSSGPLSIATTITHYALPLTISAPPLTPAALLSRTVRVEAHQDVSPIPPASMNLPPDRATAIAMGRGGTTLADIRELHYDTRTRFMDRCADTFDADPTKGSMRHDQDWYRQVSCCDLWEGHGQTALRGPVYTPGVLSGCWSGRIMIPDVNAYLSFVIHRRLDVISYPVHTQGLFCQLQEHHCLHPTIPLMPGSDDESGFGDDILNGWFPQGVTVKKLDEAIEVFDPTSGRRIRYETFDPNRPAPYSKAACEMLETSWISIGDQEEIAESPVDPVSVAQSEQDFDNDFEWSDTVEHRSSGVADILVTGETTEQHREAWGHFTYLGRVRPWDGLIVLLRTPVSATQLHNGRWIFKGYMHDLNFVGRWRETATRADMVGFEGGFVMCKTG